MTTTATRTRTLRTNTAGRNTHMADIFDVEGNVPETATARAESSQEAAGNIARHLPAGAWFYMKDLRTYRWSSWHVTRKHTAARGRGF